jgi:cytochrome c553
MSNNNIRFAPRRAWAAAAVMSAVMGALMSGASPAAAQDMQGGTDTARRAVHVCASCHGEGGRSTKPEFPSLAGMPAMYTVRQLKDFRAQQRAETDARAYMWGVSALLDDATIQSLADYYAVQKPASGHAHAPARVLARGKVVFEQGLPAVGVRACASCHGDKAEGVSGFPRLAGQHAGYLERQLNVFGTKLRPHGVLMQQEVANLKSADRKAVAAYLQSL